jgi:hypothetical protein
MQYIELTDGTTKLREGVRDNAFVYDKALTVTGFSGTENLDWENLEKVYYEADYPFITESAAYFARMSVQPNFATKVLIDNLIKGFRDDGVWASLDTFTLLNLHDKQASFLNIKGGAFEDWTSNNYAGCNWVAKTGFVNNVSNVILNSKFHPNAGTNYVLDSASIICLATGSTSGLDGTNQAGTDFAFLDWTATGTTQGLNSAQGTKVLVTGVKPTISTRGNSANFIIRTNGAETTLNVLSAVRSTGEFYFGGRENAGGLLGGSWHSGLTYKQCGFGAYMDATKRAMIEARLETFNTGIATAF